MVLSPVKRVALCGNRFQEEYLERIDRLIRLLEQSGIMVLIERNFHNYLSRRIKGGADSKVIDSPIRDVDAIVSIGGDGTFIRAARKAGRSEIPIAGVNTGHLGFLANFSIDAPEELTELLRRGGAPLERRSLMKIECDTLPAQMWPYALNEVTLLKEETSSMININVNINGFFLADYLADGLIIATPTGSTAYNLSVGGPILQPDLECMVLSPVAPHSLTQRPIVVDGNSRLEMTVTSRATEFRISIDGTSFTLPCGEKVRVEKGDFNVIAVRRPGENFSSTLRDKLHWASR